MPTFFVINELNEGYSWEDFEFCDFAYDYAVDAHNIPEECIENIDVSLDLKKVEITLVEDREIIYEDWYYCLIRFAS